MIKMLLNVILKLLNLAHSWAREHILSWVTSRGDKPVFEELFHAREKHLKHLIFLPAPAPNPGIFLEDLYISIWLLSREMLFLSHLHCIFSSDINMN